MGLPWRIAAALLLISLSISAGNESDQENVVATFIVRVQNEMNPMDFSSTVKTLTSGNDEGSISYGNDFIHVYTSVFQGFSARMTASQAENLRQNDAIIGVFPDRIRHLQTTHSPEFLGLGGPNTASLLTESDYGSDVIIGVLDTGISPEHPSFSDVGIPPVPIRWKGECVPGENFPATLCNKKLIGARFFSNGYAAVKGPHQYTWEMNSTRDTEGHGTHTASTVAGRKVPNASFFGYAAGTATGIAPRARIASYKVCWLKGCFDSDIIAAFDAAIRDGVDIISLSLSSGADDPDLSKDAISVAAFGAMERGIFVSASAGNSGPQENSVANVSPWIMTVGAGSIDRDFPAELILQNGKKIKGVSVYSGDVMNAEFPLFYAGGSDFFAATCQPGSLNPLQVKNKIVICDRALGSRAAMGFTVQNASGMGLVVVSDTSIADNPPIPGMEISEIDGFFLKNAIQNKTLLAKIVTNGTRLGTKPAPVLASFSARGPNPQSLLILKPDVIAPGLNILAAWPNRIPITGIPTDKRSTEFNIISGTSMSCPHVSGIAALLKGAHPNWSPAMIKSAIMTTAYSRDNRNFPIQDLSNQGNSSVWGIGNGHVNPRLAVDPGLVYDLKPADYIAFLCESGYNSHDLNILAGRKVSCSGSPPKGIYLNYPAISVVFNASGLELWSVASVERTVTHVSHGGSTYKVAVTEPKDVIFEVRPRRMVFKGEGEKQRYVVKVRSKKMGVTSGNLETLTGSLTWTDGRHHVTSTVLVIWQ